MSKKEVFSAQFVVLSVCAAILVGICIGVLIGLHDSQIKTDVQAEHDHSEHAHTLFNISSQIAPRVKLTVTPDAISGWNVYIETTNFTFAPEHSGMENVPGEGHAHLYIGNVKVARMYGQWHHISSINSHDEKVKVSVTLSTNNHLDYAIDGKIITDYQYIILNESQISENSDHTH